MYDLGPFPGVVKKKDASFFGRRFKFKHDLNEWKNRLLEFDTYESVDTGLYKREVYDSAYFYVLQERPKKGTKKIDRWGAC